MNSMGSGRRHSRLAASTASHFGRLAGSAQASPFGAQLAKIYVVLTPHTCVNLTGSTMSLISKGAKQVDAQVTTHTCMNSTRARGMLEGTLAVKDPRMSPSIRASYCLVPFCCMSCTDTFTCVETINQGWPWLSYLSRHVLLHKLHAWLPTYLGRIHKCMAVVNADHTLKAACQLKRCTAHCAPHI